MIIALPILVPLAVIILLLIFKRTSVSYTVGLLGTIIELIISLRIFHLVRSDGMQVIQAGSWQAPFGITLVIDTFSAIMLVLSGIVGLSVAIYAKKYIIAELYKFRFFIFFHALIMGVNGAFITGDVFNLYVWFEVMLMASFVLITLGSTKRQLEGGIKYLTLNLVSSLLFLAGIGLLYGKTGTLNMAHLASILKYDDQAILMNTSSMLFFIAFGIKAALFPLFFWLPSSYHTPPVAITALFAGLLTKVGVYAMIRFFTLFFVQNPAFWHPLLLILAGLTMLIGGITAASHYEMRRILSFHIISQIGYMVMGLGIFTPLAIAGSIYFMAHNIIAKTNTFLVSGIINKLKGSYYLKESGGLLKTYPFLSLLFIIPAFALAGVPPLSGFFGKLTLVMAGFNEQKYIITSIAIITGMLTLFSMIKIWNEAFLKKAPDNENNKNPTVIPGFADYAPSIFLGSISIILGVFAAYFINLMMDAANELLNSDIYIKSVLK